MSNKQIFLHNTATGSYWLPEPGSDHVIRSIIDGLIFDQPLVDEMKRLCKPGSVVLDVGSNFGQTAVIMSKHVDQNGMVVAFEADPWIYRILRSNLSINNCTNSRAIFGAVWDEPGCELIYPEADLVRFESYGSYGIDPTANDGQKVPSITIDSVGINHVDLIKIDVQGSDLRAMKGAQQTIKRSKPIIIFEYESMFDQQFETGWDDYLEFIEMIDYEIVGTISSVNFVMVPRTRA